LERRAHEIHRGLEAERAARERAERMLENMRQAHRRVQEIVGELRSVILRLRSTAPAPDAERAAPSPAAERVIPPQDAERATPAPPVEQRGGRGGEMEIEPLVDGDTARREEMAAALAAAVQRLRARAEEQPVAPVQRRPAHKHSMSLIARLRAARKQRRELR
jgi:hypothetical protein